MLGVAGMAARLVGFARVTHWLLAVCRRQVEPAPEEPANVWVRKARQSDWEPARE